MNKDEINLNKEKLIKSIILSESDLLKIKDHLLTYVNNEKAVNSLKYLVLYVLNFNMWYIIFSLFSIQVNKVSVMGFLLVIFISSFTIYMIQKIKLSHYDENTVLLDVDKEKIKKWIKEEDQFDEHKKTIVEKLIFNSYIVNDCVKIKLVDQDLFAERKKENLIKQLDKI